MKFEFQKKDELGDLITKIMNTETSHIDCIVDYSEDLHEDCVEVYENGELKETIEMKDMLEVLSKHFGEEIISYDVIEVGDLGEGFAFFFKAPVAKKRNNLKVA